MHENYLDRIIREKLQSLEVPLNSADWDLLESALNHAFDNLIASKLTDHKLSYQPQDWEIFAQSLDSIFDETIREKLGIEQLDTSPADWSLMAAMLNGDTMDLEIVDKLRQHELDFVEEDWDLMLSKLGEHPVDARNEAFDQAIREKISGHPEINFSETDWADMTVQLDGGPFDTSIREKLYHYSVPFNRPDWFHMEDVLSRPLYQEVRHKLFDHHISYRKKDWKAMAALLAAESMSDKDIIPWYKNWRNYLATASVILLLLLSGLWMFKQNPAIRLNSPLAQQSTSSPSNISQDDPNNTLTDLSVSGTESDPADPQLSSAGQTDIEDNKGKTPLTTLPSLNSVSILNPQNVVPQQATILSPPVWRPEPLIAETSENEIALNKEKTLLRNWFVHPLSVNTFANPWFHDVDSRKRGIHKVSLFSEKGRPNFRFGIYAGTSNTKVELNGPQQSQNASFLSTFVVGSRIDFRIDDSWRVVSGLNFSRRKFEHKYRTRIQGDAYKAENEPEETLTQFIKAELDFVEIPLLIRYNFPSSTPLNLYAQAGFAPLLSLSENYVFFTENENPNLNQIQDPDNFKKGRYLEQKWNFNPYAGNIFIAAGFEYTLNNSMALQLEPYFQLSLQRTRGSGSLGLEKKMYTSGISLSLMYGSRNK